MGRIEIDKIWDRVTSNDVNTNFEYLFIGVSDLDQAIRDLVIDAGGSDAEVVQARGGEDMLNDHLDKIDYTIGEKVNSSDMSDTFTGVAEEIARVDGVVDELRDELEHKTCIVVSAEEPANARIWFEVV